MALERTNVSSSDSRVMICSSAERARVLLTNSRAAVRTRQRGSPRSLMTFSVNSLVDLLEEDLEEGKS